MDDFEKELKLGFLEEASGLLEEAEQCYLQLESNPDDESVIDLIFRIAHNIKGSSKAVGFSELGEFTHHFETFLLKCKNKEIPLSKPVIDVLLACNDHITKFVHGLKEDLGFSIDSSLLLPILENSDAFKQSDEPVETPNEEQAQELVGITDENLDSASESLEIPSREAFGSEPLQESPESAQIPDPVQAQASQSVAHVAKVEEKKVEKNTPSPASSGSKKVESEESIRVSVPKLEKLLNFVGELVILETVLKEQAFVGNIHSVRRTIQQMNKVTKEVQGISMSLRMIPLKQTFQKMQRIVRDTAQMTSKTVNLVIQGEETEVDKTVLEALGDPLVHMIRNAVDHGIETPEERKQVGKSASGQVILRAFHQADKLVIEIKDNGKGIHPDVIRRKAVEKGIFKSADHLSDQQAIQLIFHPGFSTKEQVTEVSGRGVGMDVVKTNIEKIQGQVEVFSKVGEGSTFRVSLPLTLAIIDGMIVRSGKERFVIPLTSVHESTQLKNEDIQETSTLGKIFKLRGENLPAYKLCELLKVKQDENAKEKIAIITRNHKYPYAMLVDDIVGQYQVVIKQLGTELKDRKGFVGSAILGDGKPSLILEMNDLVPVIKGETA